MVSLWHAQLPSVAGSRNRKQNIETECSKLSRSQRSTLNAHSPCFARLRFIFANADWPLDLHRGGTIEIEQDEAYQWTWSKHLALSYTAPPGIALISSPGLRCGADNAFGVRFFLAAVRRDLSVMVLRLFAREVSARAGFWLLLAVSARRCWALARS